MFMNFIYVHIQKDNQKMNKKGEIDSTNELREGNEKNERRLGLLGNNLRKAVIGME